MIPRTVAALSLVAWVGLACPAGPVSAQGATEDRGLGEERRITAVDAVVELTGPRAFGLQKDLARGEPAVLPDEIDVRVDGRDRPVVGIAPLGSDGEAWAFTLYVDLAGSDLVQTAWALDRLLDQAEALTALGTVEVILADPEPRLLVPATRQPDALVQALAGLVLMPRGDDQLGVLRTDLLAAVRGLDPASTEGLAAGGLAEERRLARQLRDDLLATAVSPVRAPGPQRVLFLISGGHDLAPERFYGALGDLGERGVTVGRMTAADLEDGGLVAPTERLARTLDAYGWTVFPLVPPALVHQTRGLKLGKWRVGMSQMEPHQTLLEVDRGTPMSWLAWFGAVYEQDRDPEAARTYLELGRARLEQGDAEGAVRVLGRALHHFAEDAATADDQAEAYVLLSRAFEDAGQGERARLAARRAARLAPETAAEAGLVIADPPGLGSLALLADGTGGELLGSGGALDKLLRSLDGAWVRVTFQMEGLPDGRLHPLEIRRTPGSGARPAKLWNVGRAPAVVRSSTPPAVAEARLRRFAAGAWQDPADGAEVLSANLWVRAGDGGPELVLAGVRDDAPALRVEGESRRALRVSLGYPQSPDATSREIALAFEHLEPVAVARDADGAEAPLAVLPLAFPAGAEVAAVLVEDLVTGSWTTRLVELR